MFEYLCSVSVKVLEAYITGHPFCNSTAPSPCLDASHCIEFSALESKYAKTGSVVTVLLMPSNARWCSGSHLHTVSFLYSLSNGGLNSANAGVYLERWLTIPRKLQSSVSFLGGCIFTIALILPSSAFRPSGVSL